MEPRENRIIELRIEEKYIRGGLVRHIERIPSPTEPINEDLELDDDSLRKKTINLLVDLQYVLSDLLQTNYQSIEEEDRKIIDGRIDEHLDRLVNVLGEQLYEILIKGDIEKQLIKAREDIDESKLDSIRLQLEFDSSQKKIEEISAWPWEYLRIPKAEGRVYSGEFVGNFTNLMLNRRLCLKGGAKARPIRASKPVNVLLVVAGPIGETGVVYRNTLITLEKLRDQGVIKLEELCEIAPEKEDLPGDYEPQATFTAFNKLVDLELVDLEKRREQKEKLPHIIHFIGHGKREGRQGKLAFIKEGGEPDWVEDSIFAQVAAKSPNLRLVFLQACESALPDPYSPVSGVAQALAHKRIPAVIGMQAKIANDEANTFATEFYSALAKGDAVDVAVRAGRRAIKDQLKNVAFGVPVLYLWSYEPLIEIGTAGREGEIGPPPKKLTTLECPRCKKTIEIVTQEQSSFCPGCGFMLFCEECRVPVRDPDAKFCTNCNKRINQIPWDDGVDRHEVPPPRPPGSGPL